MKVLKRILISHWMKPFLFCVWGRGTDPGSLFSSRVSNHTSTFSWKLMVLQLTILGYFTGWLCLSHPWLGWSPCMVRMSIVTAVWGGPRLRSSIAGSAGMADSGLQAGFKSELCPSVAM